MPTPLPASRPVVTQLDMEKEHRTARKQKLIIAGFLLVLATIIAVFGFKTYKDNLIAMAIADSSKALANQIANIESRSGEPISEAQLLTLIQQYASDNDVTVDLNSVEFAEYDATGEQGFAIARTAVGFWDCMKCQRRVVGFRATFHYKAGLFQIEYVHSRFAKVER